MHLETDFTIEILRDCKNKIFPSTMLSGSGGRWSTVDDLRPITKSVGDNFAEKTNFYPGKKHYNIA